MKKHSLVGWQIVLAVLLVSCVLFGMALTVVADNGNGIGIPSTGEKPSAMPYILGGVMLLCVVVIVLLFFPKKQKKDTPPKDDEE